MSLKAHLNEQRFLKFTSFKVTSTLPYWATNLLHFKNTNDQMASFWISKPQIRELVAGDAGGGGYI